MTRSGAGRSSRPVTLALAAGTLVVLAAMAVGLSRVVVDTGIDSFVPRGDASYADLVARDADFGGDPVVVLLDGTSSGGLVADSAQLPQLVRLEGALAALPDVAVVYGPGTVLNQTANSVKNVLAQISGRRDALENTARAAAREQGLSPAQRDAYVAQALTAFDRRYGALLGQALPMGLPSLRNQRFVLSVLFGADGEPRPEWRFLVPSAKSATLLVRPREGLDQTRTADLAAAVAATIEQARTDGLQVEDPVVTGVPALTAAVSEAASAEAPRLGLLALAAVGLVFLLLPWSRRRRDRLRPVLTALLGTGTTIAAFGLADRPLSLGVVAFLPIVLGIGSDFPLYLSQPTQRRRVIAAALAGAAGFAALGLSTLPFVREFGLALALGVVATLAWATLLGRLLPPVEPGDHAGPSGSEAPPAARRPVRLPGRLTGRMPGRVPTPVRRGAVGLAGIAAILGWVLLPGLRVESSPQQLAAGLPALDQVRTAEQVLGFSGEISIVLRPTGTADAPPEAGSDADGSGGAGTVTTTAALDWARAADEVLLRDHGDQLSPLLTMSQLLDFLGADATGEQIVAGASLLPPYLLNAVVTADYGVASSSYGVQLEDLAEQDVLLRELRRELPAPPPGYTAEVVGLPVVATSGINALSTSRWLIGLAALAAAVLVVGGLLRSWRLAATVLLVAGVATGWVYLALAMLGVDLSPLTLAVGALITVTSCEFTVMLDASRAETWLRRSVATAALAGTVGYLCLAFSDLAVLRDFGLVLAAGVAASYLAARLVIAQVPDAGAAPTADRRRLGAAEYDGADDRAEDGAAPVPVAEPISH